MLRLQGSKVFLWVPLRHDWVREDRWVAERTTFLEVEVGNPKNHHWLLVQRSESVNSARGIAFEQVWEQEESTMTQGILNHGLHYIKKRGPMMLFSGNTCRETDYSYLFSALLALRGGRYAPPDIFNREIRRRWIAWTEKLTRAAPGGANGGPVGPGPAAWGGVDLRILPGWCHDLKRSGRSCSYSRPGRATGRGLNRGILPGWLHDLAEWAR